MWRKCRKQSGIFGPDNMRQTGDKDNDARCRSCTDNHYSMRNPYPVGNHQIRNGAGRDGETGIADETATTVAIMTPIGA